MPTNRDTQFLGFAMRVIKDLDEVHALRMDIVSDELEELIARRAYDLVEHTLDHCTSSYDKDVIYDVSAIPDLPVLPEEHE